MMHIPNEQKNVSNYEAFKSTLEADAATAAWFSFLITQPSAQEKLSTLKVNLIYLKKLPWIKFFNTMAEFALLALIIIIFFTRNLWLGIPFVAFGLMEFFMIRLRKRMTAFLGNKIIAEHFNEEKIKDITLFEACESLSKTYGTFSLVDYIYYREQLLRATLSCGLGVFLFLKLLYFPLFVQTLTILAIFRTHIIFKKTFWLVRLFQ